MRHSHPIPLLLALLGLTACGDDQSPTGPTRPTEPGGPAYSHTPGHKVVNSLADPGNGVCNATQCTLREAIEDPRSTEISFTPGLTGTITLARFGLGGGPLVIDKALTITGPSAGIAIDRRSTDPAFRIMRVDSGVIVKLINLTLRNGKTDRTGGGLINFGRLTLTNGTVAGNSAVEGGGIENHGRLTLTNSRVTNNHSTAGSGGGISNFGNLTLANTLVTGNSATSHGGGIINQKAGRLALTKSTIAENSASFHGGGIANLAGTATLTTTRIVDNSSSFDDGGGIFNTSSLASIGQITLVNSTVARNSTGSDGGGIANVQGGSIAITKSTIAGNSAGRTGGGIFQRHIVRTGGEVTLRNSTVSGNSANLVGGGIFNDGDDAAVITLTNSTVARNSASLGGGGIQLGASSGASLQLTNTLVGQNSAPTVPDVDDPSGGDGGVIARFSLIGNGSGSGITNTNGNQVGTASAPIDPKLGSLADNGGPTRTHALLLGSPAIDAASTPDCPLTDQRGVLRPQGAACDIGSYERK